MFRSVLAFGLVPSVLTPTWAVRPRLRSTNTMVKISISIALFLFITIFLKAILNGSIYAGTDWDS